MFDPEQQDSSQSASSPMALARGAACLPCRRRKMRCDGKKPVCSPCIAKDRQEDCEYTGDIQGLTKTQLLEENISLLEARISELENPSEATSVKLRDVPGPSAVPLTLMIPGSSNVAPSGPAPGPSAVPASASVSEPTVQDVHNMINNFIPCASKVGFFLNTTRFIQLAYLPVDQRDPLTDSLVSAVCLWGSRLSRDTPLHAFEEHLLTKAVQGVSTSLFLANSGDRGHAILRVIQAEVLLANYFFALGRFLEGRYHSCAAASLTVTCRLNTLGLPLATGAQGGLGMGLVHGSHPGFPAAAAAADAVEQGERVDAFWAVYVLDKCWSVALESPSAISDSSTSGTRISTPWPLSMAQYEQGRVATYTGVPVISEFLNGHTIGNLDYFSPFALRAQASTLFSQASVLASRYRDDMPDKPLFWHEFAALDNLINNFIDKFPPAPVALHDDTSELLIARTLAHIATIQLHIRFSEEQPASRGAFLAAASAVLAAVQSTDPARVGCMDPIMAILLSTVCQVYLGELKAYGRADDGEYVAGVRTSLDRVLATMEGLGDVCPLMAIQVQGVRAARADL